MTFSLTVEPREARGKRLQTLRRAGKLPGIVYGPKEKAMALSCDRVQFEKLLDEAGESSVITLKGLEKPLDVLVHDVAFDPRRGGPTHVDFYAIEVGKEVTVHVPLEFEGEAPAVRLGGTLTKVLHEIEVTCVPQELPQSITVDTTMLEDFEDRILVKDLSVPEGVTIENNPEDVVALVQEVEEEPEEQVVEEVDMDAIEVEHKGKELEEEDAETEEEEKSG